MRENKLFTCVRGCVCSMEKVDEGGRQCCLGEELTFEKYNIVFTYAEGECYFCCFDCGCYGNEKR